MKEKKKILMFIDSIGYGGAQKQFVCLANLLKSKGYQVKILVIYDELDFYFSSLNGIEILCDQKSRSHFMRLIRIPRIMANEKPDVVISYLDSQCILACLAKLLGGFKVIVSERNTTQVLNFRERIKFWTYKLADYIVPNSYAQGDFIIKNYHSLSNKVRVITNVIEDREFRPAEKKVNNDVPQIISVGRNVYQKNYLGMVETVKILKDRGVNVHFNWYAEEYPCNYYQGVYKKISEYNLHDMISIFKPVKEIADKYRESDFFWLASFFEGFPNVLCEAMKCGLPVACSNVCDNPHIVEEGVNGYLFNPNSPKEMADKIEKLLNLNKIERGKMIKANVAKIEELCSSSVFLEKYIKLIES